MLHIADHDFKSKADEVPAFTNSVQPTGTWRIETLNNLAKIRNHAQEWLALERECDDPYTSFQSYVWCESWALAFCKTTGTPQPRIFFIYKGDTLVAILPMMVNTHMGARILTLFGEPHSQIANAITKNGVDCTDGLKLCIKQAAFLSDADVVAFGPLPEDSQLRSALDNKYLSPDPAETMSLVTWPGVANSEEYLNGLKKNRRKDFKRKHRQLQREDGVKFERFHVGDPKFKPLAKKALSLKREWLERNGMVSIGLAQAGMEKFLCSFTDRSGGTKPIVEALSIGDEPIAICIVLESATIRHCYLAAYDPDYMQLSPGTMLHQYSIHNAIDRGLEMVNFLGFPTHFKNLWATKKEPLLRYQQALTLRGVTWLRLWIGFIRPAAKRVLARLRHLTKLPLIGTPLGLMLSKLAPKNG